MDSDATEVRILDGLSKGQWLAAVGGVALVVSFALDASAAPPRSLALSAADVCCAKLCVLIVNCVFKRRRWRALQEVRSELLSAEFVTLRDLPRHAYQLVALEAQKERSTRVVPAWKLDCGWGAPGSEYDGVHFNTFIGCSLHIIEHYALKRHASLKACGTPRGANDLSRSELACDVGEFLERIRAHMNGELDKDLCAQYVAFYRHARMAGRESSESEFRSFLRVLHEILRRIERD